MTKKDVGRDLTQGPVFNTLLTFAVPMVMTSLIQQIYSMVDLMVIGQFVGNTGTVGVSVGGEYADLVAPIAMGFSSGGQIFIAQLAGAGDTKKVKETVGTLLTFMMGLAALLTIFGIAGCVPLLNLLNCPEEAFSQAVIYMIITSIGIPFIFGYNAVNGVLCGMGESTKPMFFISVAAIVNVVLDLVLVAAFGMGAAGTAIATMLSQFGSFLAALIYLYKKRERFDFSFSRSYFVIKKDLLMVILRLGIPQVVRSMLVRISMLWVTSSINAYGLIVSTTNSVGNKIQKFADIFTQGVNSASAAVIGQSLGARKTDRARKTVWVTLAMTMACATAVALCCIFIPEQLFGIFTTDETVIAMGAVFLQIMIIHFYASAFIGPFQAMVTGCGFVSLGFVIGILDGVVCKIGLSLIFVNILGMGYEGYFWGIACSRILPGLLCFAYFLSGKWKTRKLLADT